MQNKTEFSMQRDSSLQRWILMRETWSDAYTGLALFKGKRGLRFFCSFLNLMLRWISWLLKVLKALKARRKDSVHWTWRGHHSSQWQQRKSSWLAPASNAPFPIKWAILSHSFIQKKANYTIHFAEAKDGPSCVVLVTGLQCQHQ